jgi:hypothetical protein
MTKVRPSIGRSKWADLPVWRDRAGSPDPYAWHESKDGDSSASGRADFLEIARPCDAVHDNAEDDRGDDHPDQLEECVAQESFLVSEPTPWNTASSRTLRALAETPQASRFLQMR